MIPADLSISSIVRQQDTSLRRTKEQQGKHLLLVLALLRSNADFSKDCLQSLFLQEMLSRENDITDATAETSDMCLAAPAYGRYNLASTKPRDALDQGKTWGGKISANKKCTSGR